jgi:hypothetical protein
MSKNDDLDLEDDLRPEYDLKTLRLVRRGPGREASSNRTVQLAPDVAEAFPDEAAVNEALRFLLRATRKELKQEA